MTRFTDIEPTLENYWRGVILFGLNVASYKFALGKSLLELSKRSGDLVSILIWKVVLLTFTVFPIVPANNFLVRCEYDRH